MATSGSRRAELVDVAARLFAERGYHGTSMADLAEAMGVQKGSLYSLTESKQELLVAVARDGATAFHAALDGVPEDLTPLERIRSALGAHLEVVAAQLDSATVFTREWRFLQEPARSAFRAERRRYEERWHELLREAADRGALRADLDVDAAVLLVLSAANWAYTWLRPGADTTALADRFFAILLDGVRGYAPADAPGPT
jgi:AcrR family transcriptional regulator